jgi:hypothetical protein
MAQVRDCGRLIRVAESLSRTVAVFVAALLPALTRTAVATRSRLSRSRRLAKTTAQQRIFTEIGGITADWQGQF